MRLVLSIVLGLHATPALWGQTLPAPTGVDASDGAYSIKVGIAWEHVRGAKLYRVFRGETGDPAAAVDIGSTPSILFFDTGATPDQVHYYWVRAENGAQTSPLSKPDTGYKASGRTSAFGRIGPLSPPPEPPENPVTGAKVYLGKTLFWDEQLSSTRTVACGTCHRPRNGGADPRSIAGAPSATHPGPDGRFGTDDDIIGSPGVPLSRADGSYAWSPHFGMREQVTRRKAQPVFEAAYADMGILWDGRAGPEFKDPSTGQVLIARSGSLEAQALEPFLDTAEMAHIGRDLQDLTGRIAESRPLALAPSLPEALAAWIGERGYPELFEEAFGGPEVTPARVALAIASYERTLFSDRTGIDAIDQALREEPEPVQRGRSLFFTRFCDECHRGTLLGDNRFRSVGVRPDHEDTGRAEVTRDSRDRGRFRTPSLRNAGIRSPFMHNGRFATLADTVEFYDRGGDFSDRTGAMNRDEQFLKPMGLDARSRADLEAFLDALTDPRVAAEAGPLFDRPTLYSESARVPRVVGAGRAAPDGVVPKVQAVEPPVAGNPDFTVGLFDAEPGAQAELVIGREDPGMGLEIPAMAVFHRSTAAVAAAEGSTKGYASAVLNIPSDPALTGATLFGRWFVRGAGGVSVTPAFRMTIFDPRPVSEPGLPLFSSLSAASLTAGVTAPDSLVSGFGASLADRTEAALSTDLPTQLAGVSVIVTDSAGAGRAAPLYFVSPGQINYLIPAGTAPGDAEAAVVRNGAPIARGRLQVAETAPALFSANADGRGAAAALALFVTQHGTHDAVTVRFDDAAERYVPEPIDLGGEDDQLFLMLFGSGIRFHGQDGVEVRIGGAAAEVLFAGPQPEFPGLDQVNVRAPRNLAGRGEVDVVVSVDGQLSNPVRVNVR